MTTTTTEVKRETGTASVPVTRTQKPEARKGELVRGNPWRLFEDMREEMEGLWRGARNWPAFPHLPKLAAKEGAAWLPSTDVYRAKGKLVVKADLPGLKREDVEVMLEDGYLVVKGERREEKEEKEKEFFRSECSYGSFYRRVPLPDGVDPETISAKVHDGVLEVTVPLPAEEAKEAKKIKVS